jgi:hypothetical protein
MFETKFLENNRNTHLIFNNFIFENRVVYEILRKIIVEPGRQQMTTRRMRIAYWMPQVTKTHAQNM